MNSLRQIIESSPRVGHLTPGVYVESAQPLAPARWDWSSVRKILVVRLRSIGDTVLATPSLFALRRFVPQAKLDILLEDWVAPVLDGSDLVDHVITIPRHSNAARARVARELHRANYDVVYNLHGGTTATFLTRATAAKHRVGFANYQYSRLHNYAAPSPLEIWQRPTLHSVEQQLALIGWTGVPVTDRPATKLAVTAKAAASISQKLSDNGVGENESIALIHPAAAFATKQWATENFAQVAEAVGARGFTPVAVVAPNEKPVLQSLKNYSSVRVIGFDNLSLPEITALASRAKLFVGNDSGIAHIAAAVSAPCVVVFGSSNIAHWRPWTTNANELVREEMPCQPCHGYFCAEFAKPECILRIPVDRVVAAIDRVLAENKFAAQN
ncbi:MAG TPA: glycosyltransferase family 9 protein [Pyrinomonadaceae bacterium]|nr:glycosyltransferase family 9 protein [Pyrinomonadaceae bacterium]